MATPSHPAPSPLALLKYLYPGWYAVVMGVAGLALAWHRATPTMDEAAGTATWVIGLLAAAVFVALAAATLLRWQRHPKAWAEDLAHPVRHTFVATLPIAVLLLATVAVATGRLGQWSKRFGGRARSVS